MCLTIDLTGSRRLRLGLDRLGLFFFFFSFSCWLLLAGWDGQRTATFGVDFFLSKPRQGIPVVQPNRMFTVPANGPYVGDRSTGYRSRRPYQLGWSPGLGPSVGRRNVESRWPIHRKRRASCFAGL